MMEDLEAFAALMEEALERAESIDVELPVFLEGLRTMQQLLSDRIAGVEDELHP